LPVSIITTYVKIAVKDWKRDAIVLGISKKETEARASAFKHHDSERAKALP
jgi:hypothetical protein